MNLNIKYYSFNIMNFTILNPSNYDIKEINFGDNLSKKFIEDVKKMKKFICKRSKTLKNDEININSDFIVTQLSRLKDDSSAFAFVSYQKVINYNIQIEKPTAILIARKGSKKDVYILTLLCKYESAIKGLGTILLNKLIEKAKLNDVKYIYTESTPNAYSFYKKNDFDSDSEKDNYTESDKDESLFGYLYVIDKNINGGNQINDNNILQEYVQEHKLNKYRYELFGKVSCKLKLYDFNDICIGSAILDNWSHPYYSYISFEITNVNVNNEENKEILFHVIDNICKKNYIHKTFSLIEHNNEDEKHFYENQEYEYKKDKMNLMMYEKIHNKTYIIDRTVLSIG